MSIDLDQARAALLSRREALTNASRESAEMRDPVVLDQQRVGRVSRMDALQMQAMAEAEESRRTLDLKRIAAALRRLDGGDYGYCLRCGEEIAPRRLALDPAITLCIECARREEG